MDGWVDGWVGGRMGGWMEKWVGGEVTPVQPKASLRTEALSGEAATVKWFR